MEKEIFMRAKAILYVALGLSLLVALGQPVPAQTGATCGGIGALKCPAGQACQFPSGQCNQPEWCSLQKPPTGMPQSRGN